LPSLTKRLGDSASLLAPLFFAFLVWEAMSRLKLINPILLPPPSKALMCMYRLLIARTPDGHSILLMHIYHSFYRLLYGFFAAAVIGVALGLAMGMNKYVYGYFNPIISVMVPVPGITWAPILILWLGFGDPTIIAVAFIAAFFPIVYNTAAGARSISKELIWATQTMGANGRTIFFRVLLPWSAAYILTGLKLGLARSWRTLIAVEMIAATLWGLGYMIFDAREFLLTDVIYGGIILLAVIFFMIENVVIRAIEEKTIEKWGMKIEI